MNKFGVAIALVAVLVGLASVASAHFEAAKRPQNQKEDFELEQKLHETDASQHVKQQKVTEGSEQEEPEHFSRRQEPVKGRRVPVRGGRRQQNQGVQRPGQTEDVEVDQKVHETDASQTVKAQVSEGSEQEEAESPSRRNEPVKGRKGPFRGRRQQNQGVQRPGQTEDVEVDQRVQETDASQNVKAQFSESPEQEGPESPSRRQEPVKGRKGPVRGHRQQNQGVQRPGQTEDVEVDQRVQETDASQNVKVQFSESPEQEGPESPSRRREPVKGRKGPVRGRRQHPHPPQSPGHQGRRPEHKGFPVRGPYLGRNPRVGVCGGAVENKSGRGEPEGENVPEAEEEQNQGPEEEVEAERK